MFKQDSSILDPLIYLFSTVLCRNPDSQKRFLTINPDFGIGVYRKIGPGREELHRTTRRGWRCLNKSDTDSALKGKQKQTKRGELSFASAIIRGDIVDDVCCAYMFCEFASCKVADRKVSTRLKIPI